MGGAFIDVADDATAASWNPGGLTQLERPEMSVVYSWKWFGEEFADTFHLYPESSYDLSLHGLNYLSGVYPIPWTIGGRNLVVSLNYQQKFDFDRSFDFEARDTTPLGGVNSFLSRDMDISFDQKGSLSALSPAFGFELTDRLSCGLVANLWDTDLLPDNTWEATTKRRVKGRIMGTFNMTAIGRADTYEKYDDVSGTNYTFGLLYRLTERLKVGAVYHTKFALGVDYKRLDLMHNPFFATYYESRLRLEFPSAYGLGVAYRFPNDKLTLSLDVTKREWDEYVQVDPRGGVFERRISPITGMPKSMSPHDPTYSVRLGGEYVFIDATKPVQNYMPSLRAGLFYDPEPASGRTDRWWWVAPGDGTPDDYYGATLGLGVLIKNRVNVDLAYQYRWGNNVRKDTLAGAGPFENGFSEDVQQHNLYLSTVIYF
jgi:long-subunit fatty acid transport protein